MSIKDTTNRELMEELNERLMGWKDEAIDTLAEHVIVLLVDYALFHWDHPEYPVNKDMFTKALEEVEEAIDVDAFDKDIARKFSSFDRAISFEDLLVPDFEVGPETFEWRHAHYAANGDRCLYFRGYEEEAYKGGFEIERVYTPDKGVPGPDWAGEVTEYDEDGGRYMWGDIELDDMYDLILTKAGEVKLYNEDAHGIIA